MRTARSARPSPVPDETVARVHRVRAPAPLDTTRAKSQRTWQVHNSRAGCLLLSQGSAIWSARLARVRIGEAANTSRATQQSKLKARYYVWVAFTSLLYRLYWPLSLFSHSGSANTCLPVSIRSVVSVDGRRPSPGCPARVYLRRLSSSQRLGSTVCKVS